MCLCLSRDAPGLRPTGSECWVQWGAQCSHTGATQLLTSPFRCQAASHSLPSRSKLDVQWEEGRLQRNVSLGRCQHGRQEFNKDPSHTLSSSQLQIQNSAFVLTGIFTQQPSQELGDRKYYFLIPDIRMIILLRSEIIQYLSRQMNSLLETKFLINLKWLRIKNAITNCFTFPF